jgi:uncharacterized UBP type Zn finger protein
MRSQLVLVRVRGATCYLNSFIQSLYMMPEFRSAVYEWKHNPETHKDEDTCIPLQMQKLFARLQVCFASCCWRRLGPSDRASPMPMRARS